MSSKKSNSLIVPFCIIGFFIGGIIGFLYRPSAFLIGQLPLDVILTRGANLKGVDQVLVTLAQSSFNNMIAIALIGALIGIAAGYMLSKR
jgi:hypothetical protein